MRDLENLYEEHRLTRVSDIAMGELDEIKRRKLEEMMRQGEKSLTHPLVLTDKDFDLKLNENNLIIVDFWAEWCMPCRMMAPVFERLASKYAGKITFAKLNVDENMETARRFSVFSIPTLILFSNAKPVDRIVGYTEEEGLDEHLKPHLD